MFKASHRHRRQIENFGTVKNLIQCA